MATPPQGQLPRIDGGIVLRGTPRDIPDTPINYLRELDQICHFLAGLQVQDVFSPDHGGMREEEAAGMSSVIQTDNTLEAIWCWSRYRELTGLETFDHHLALAWYYCENFPAWEEEYFSFQSFYRAHNCAWALAAVRQYEAATGDTTKADYAQQSAAYIVANPLDLNDPDAYYRTLNIAVKGWCAGNLCAHGRHLGDPGLMQEAVSQGQDVLERLNQDLPDHLNFEIWAMSGGTALWGVCESVFRADPVAGVAWIEAHGDQLETWVEYSGPSPDFNWDTSWNVAYANAHFAMADVSGDPAHELNGRNITHGLLALDTDDDGGIMATMSLPTDADASWVTAYLLKFGVDRLLGQPHQQDTGVLGFPDLVAGQVIAAGQPYPLRVLVTNYGLQAQTGVPVVLEIGSEVLETTVDLDMAGQGVVELDPAFIFSGNGSMTLAARTSLTGDEDPANDAAQISVTIQGASGVAAPLEAWRVRPVPNPTSGTTEFRLAGVTSGEVEVTIFDLRGRQVARLQGSAPGDLVWSGRDARGHLVSAGTYIYRARAGGQDLVGKVFQIH